MSSIWVRLFFGSVGLREFFFYSLCASIKIRIGMLLEFRRLYMGCKIFVFFLVLLI